MRVQRVLETCLYAEDLAAAEAFYTEVLGLAVLSRVEGRHVFFRCGENVFLLFDPRATELESGRVPAHGARGPGHIAFAVDRESLPAWREALAAQGVAIEMQVQWPSGGDSLYFRDPAGNSVELTSPQIWGLD